jgi:hypothetical protein
MRWCEQHPARERRELWIRSTWGMEVKLVAHARVMPARRGHQVLTLVHRKQLVGLRKLSTGAQVNFVRSDPPLLLRRSDGLAVLMVSIAAGLSWIVGSPGVGAMATLTMGLLPPVLIASCWHARRSLAAEVERAFESAQRQLDGRALLRLVK